MTLAYVGIGSNLDGPLARVSGAFDALSKLPQTRLLERSSLYRSAPQGYGAQPDYVNAVAKLDSALPAQELLAQLRRIEDAQGRERSFPNAPRTLDLDLLLYGKETVASKTLTLPHPRMHERAFVLVPLLELEPNLDIPGAGPASACAQACAGQRVERIP